jgi:hypothetical protein
MIFRKNKSYMTYTAYFGNLKEPHGATAAPKGEVISLTKDENGDVYGIILGEVPPKEILYRVIKYPLSIHSMIDLKVTKRIHANFIDEFEYNGDIYFIFIGPIKKYTNKSLEQPNTNDWVKTIFLPINIIGTIVTIILTILGNIGGAIGIILGLAIGRFIMNKIKEKEEKINE